MDKAEEGELVWDDVNEDQEGEPAWKKDWAHSGGKLDVDALIGSKTDNDVKGGTTGGE